MNKGKIIFLNGVTSAGKTSTAKEILALSDEMYYHISNDIFHEAADSKFFAQNHRKFISDTIIAMYYAVRGMCENGINVVVDGMILELEEYKQNYKAEHYDLVKSIFLGESIFSRIETFIVELFCPLDICKQRNIKRADREENQSEWQNKIMNKSIEYNLKIDTSKNEPRECAKQILDSL